MYDREAETSHTPTPSDPLGVTLQIDPPNAYWWLITNPVGGATIGGVLVRGDATEKWAVSATLAAAGTVKMRASTSSGEGNFNASYTPGGGYAMKGVGASPLPSFTSNGLYYFKAQDGSPTANTLKDGLWTVTDDSNGNATVAWVYIHNATQFWYKLTSFSPTHVFTWTWAADPYAGDPHAFDTAKAATNPGAGRFVCRPFTSYA